MSGAVDDANELVNSSVKRPRLDVPAVSALSEAIESAIAVPAPEHTFTAVDSSLDVEVSDHLARTTLHFTYDRWLDNRSPLTRAQRRIVEGDTILRQPVRILGAAGSGKTLVMLLLAMRRLRCAEASGEKTKVLYLTHNLAMRESVSDRFRTLGAGAFMSESAEQQLRVDTLLGLCLEELEVDETAVIDRDALASKQFQIATLGECIDAVFEKEWDKVDECNFLRQVAENEQLKEIFAHLMSYEIGISIKGRGLTSHRKLYTESEEAFSRLHRVLSVTERDLAYSIFEMYQDILFSKYEVLDGDDLAITALSRLRTPLWEMRRKREGYDFILVDETQLFNENERRVFSLLRRGNTKHVPIALALDEAQELRGATSSGFGLLGIESIADEELRSVHRCSRQILELAFRLLQNTTDLFGANFPNFTEKTVSVIPDDDKLVKPPRLVPAPASSPSIAAHVLRQVRSLRKGSFAERWNCRTCGSILGRTG